MAAGVDARARGGHRRRRLAQGLNREMRRLAEEEASREFIVENPRSRHNLGVGQTAP